MNLYNDFMISWNLSYTLNAIVRKKNIGQYICLVYLHLYSQKTLIDKSILMQRKKVFFLDVWYKVHCKYYWTFPCSISEILVKQQNELAMFYIIWCISFLFIVLIKTSGRLKLARNIYGYNKAFADLFHNVVFDIISGKKSKIFL